MSSRVVRALCVAVVAAALLGAAPASALALSYRFSGLNANAWGDWELADGGSRWVGVFAGESSGMFREPGVKPSRSSDKGLSVHMGDFLPGDPDTPADDVYRGVDLTVPGYDAGIDRDLSSAKVSGTWDATVTVFVGEPPMDPEGEWEPTLTYTTPMTIDLEWTGTGPFVREMYSSKTFSDDFRWIDHYRRTYRATTLTGSLTTLDGDNIDAADLSADLSNDRSGSIQFGTFPW